MSRIWTWCKTRLFVIHPVVPRSDWELFGFLFCAFFTLLVGLALTIAFLGGPKPPYSLIFTHLLLIDIYAAHNLSLYKIKLAILEFQNERVKKEKHIFVWRYGEILGIGLVNYLIFLIALYILGIIPNLPEEAIVVGEGVIGTNWLASLWKMKIDDEPRPWHNRLFFITSVNMTLLIVLTFARAVLHDQEIPLTIMILFVTIFAAYITHDRLMDIRCTENEEECEDQTNGYAIGLLVGVGSALIVAYLYISQIVGFLLGSNELREVKIPGEILEIIIITFAISALSDWIKDHVILKNKRKKNEIPQVPELPKEAEDPAKYIEEHTDIDIEEHFAKEDMLPETDEKQDDQEKPDPDNSNQ